VRHLVYSSISGADLRTGIPHVESKARIEEHIQALGLPATILRPVSFMDNFASFNRPVLDGGELVVSLALRPQTRLPLVATRDIGVSRRSRLTIVTDTSAGTSGSPATA